MGRSPHVNPRQTSGTVRKNGNDLEVGWGEDLNAEAPVYRIGVVEDDEQTRLSLAFLLKSAGCETFGFESAEDFLFKAAKGDLFDCLVIDACLPGLSGLQLQERIAEIAPFLSIVFVSAQDNLPLAVSAMRGGAVDFLQKPFGKAALMNALQRGIRMTRHRRGDHDQRSGLLARFATLTAREKEVFELIVVGLLNKQVGAELGISEKTVKTHRGRVMEKMGAESLADLVRRAAVLRGAHA